MCIRDRADLAAQTEMTPEVLLKSMDRLEYATDIDSVVVQEAIDYVTQLGYLKSSFKAGDILDLSFIKP